MKFSMCRFLETRFGFNGSLDPFPAIAGKMPLQSTISSMQVNALVDNPYVNDCQRPGPVVNPRIRVRAAIVPYAMRAGTRDRKRVWEIHACASSIIPHSPHAPYRRRFLFVCHPSNFPRGLRGDCDWLGAPASRLRAG